MRRGDGLLALFSVSLCLCGSSVSAVLPAGVTAPLGRTAILPSTAAILPGRTAILLGSTAVLPGTTAVLPSRLPALPSTEAALCGRSAPKAAFPAPMDLVLPHLGARLRHATLTRPRPQVIKATALRSSGLPHGAIVYSSGNKERGALNISAHRHAAVHRQHLPGVVARLIACAVRHGRGDVFRCA